MWSSQFLHRPPRRPPNRNATSVDEVADGGDHVEVTKDGERADRAPAGSPDDLVDDADGAALLARRVVQRAAETAAGVLSDAVEAGGRLVQRSHEGRVRRRSRNALPNLFDLHPDARIASRRQLGLRTIPVGEIVGTAVEGGAQRGVDFLPLRHLRSRNWRARYQRIRAAQEHLAVLPPIDVLQTDEGYWVVDGHNRVAAAMAGGQDEIDALVTHVHLPGSKEPEVASGSLAAMLADGEELRAAGAGLLTPGSSLASRLGDPGAQRRFRQPPAGRTASAEPAEAPERHQGDGSDWRRAPDEADQPDR
jgi:hypothetical protein